MRTRIVVWLLLMSAQLILTTSTSAYGQWYSGPQTPFSAGATGMSNLVRAQGDYNEQSSRAMINYQQAQSQYIDNQQKAIATRQNIKRLARAEETRERNEAHDQLVKAEEFMATHRPLPLSQNDFDPSTGQLRWPVALTSVDFIEFRKSLETLFKFKSKYGPTSEVSSQIERKTGDLKDALRGEITKIPLPEYSEARQFLDRMAMTAR